MKRKGRWILGISGGVLVVLLLLLLWPAPDPLRDAETVALRFGAEPASSPLDVESELQVVLNDRDLRIVSDEQTADVVLAVTDLQLSLGDVQISFADGRVAGRATAVCTVVDQRTGKRYWMDFVIRIKNGELTARLVPRRFWEFWKPRP